MVKIIICYKRDSLLFQEVASNDFNKALEKNWIEKGNQPKDESKKNQELYCVIVIMSL